MKAPRAFFPGLITAAASVVVVIGALSLALAEGFTLAVPTAQPAPIQTEIPMPVVTAGARITPTSTLPPVLVTATIPFAATCPVPAGWAQYTVKTGDTLAGLALRYDTSVAALMDANCLVTEALLVDTLIYVPPLLTATLTRTIRASLTPLSNIFPTITQPPCGAPLGWVRYVVQPGDTLFKISVAVGVSVQQIQFANCMGSSTLIRSGEGLWLPMIPVIPRTPSLTATHTAPAPSATPRPPTATTPAEVIPSATPETPVPSVEPLPSSSPIPSSTVPSPAPSATTGVEVLPSPSG